MQLTRVEISNYRSFASLNVGTLPATVLVVGENAVGKSNLVAALRLVLDPSLPDTARVLRREDFWDGLGHRLAAMVGDLFAVRTKLGVAAVQPDQLLRSVRLLTAAGSNARAVSDNSLGTANVIYLALLLEDLAQRRAAGDVATTVLAVEEPEAHLHPPLQRLVYRDLLRQGQPLLLTSHSPHIASVTPVGSILVLRRSAKAGTVGFTAAGAGLAPAVVDDIQRYLDVTRAEFLFAKAVLLVEGSAELFIVPSLAMQLGIDLDALGVMVCSVHGTDFAPYRKLFGATGLAVPHVILTDGDPGEPGKVPAGVLRGGRLLRQTAGVWSKVATAGKAKQWNRVRRLLRADDIFVGPWTLEVDLIPAAADKFTATYDELTTGKEKAKENFRSLVTAAGTGDAEAIDGMLNRIETIGKGRFAQRLATRLTAADAPSHISAAITRVATMAREVS